MEKYMLTKEMGDGSCGIVYKAFNRETNEFVAIKKMKRKFSFWEVHNLREVQSLRKLSHPNIVKLQEVVWENEVLSFVFEFMECNLYQIIRDQNSQLSEVKIRNFMTQFLQALAYMHKNGFFHRDLKPENLLVTNDLIKIADFGLAREVSSGPPYTDYVSTRWYRAPEVLLRSQSYTPAIDVWAVGAILAELLTSSPLFPGESEIDQLYKICAVLGTPDGASWPEGLNLCQSINFNFYQIPPANLADIIPNASPEAIDLVQRLCSWDPTRRPTAEQALRHPFFHVRTWIPYPISDPFVPQMNRNEESRLELNLYDFESRADDCFLGLTLAVNPSMPDSIHRDSLPTEEDFLFFPGFQENPRQLVDIGNSEEVLFAGFQESRQSVNAGNSIRDFLFFPGFQENSRQSAHVFEEVQLDLSLLPYAPSRCSQVPLPVISLPQSSGFANSFPNMIESRPFPPVTSSISPPVRECNFFAYI